MQFTPPTFFSQALDGEFKRIAVQEDLTMEELVEEVSRLVKTFRGKPHDDTRKCTRQVYNWRSGKWPVPSNLIPLLCRRFGSTALINALAAECSDVVVAVPEGADVPRMVSRSLKSDLALFEEFLSAHESDGFQEHELRALREKSEQAVRNIYRLVEIAGADCERRAVDRDQSKRSSSDHSKRSPQNPSDQVLTHGGGRT